MSQAGVVSQLEAAVQNGKHDPTLAEEGDFKLRISHVPQHYRRSYLQRFEPVPRLPMGSHQLREFRAGFESSQ